VEGLDMRLTDRTVEVLAAIAARPGLSNSEISQHAGVTDQGQISRLLSCLARVKLIENAGEGQRKGSANAWRLTRHGEAVEQTIRDERLPRRT
jgi:chromosome segregation and condensation protein ScpB